MWSQPAFSWIYSLNSASGADVHLRLAALLSLFGQDLETASADCKVSTC